MAGGRYDSSKTRVKPVFDYLYAADPSGESWIGPMLSLPRSGSLQPRPTRTESLNKSRSGWGDSERALQPPMALLSWLVRNIATLEGTETAETLEKRRDLVSKKPERIEEALSLIRSGNRSRKWYLLEGPTWPDVVLETSDVIIVVEGKRTESGPTTTTTHMQVRHQILRHIDAAFEIRGNRSLFGFFVVEGAEDGSVPSQWAEACARTLEADVLDRSLPHRSDVEKEQISKAFIGATTWQIICKEFDIPTTTLIDEIPA